MTTIPVYLPGVAGRMGRVMAENVINAPDLTLSAVFEVPGHGWVGRSLNDIFDGQFPMVKIQDAVEGPPIEGRAVSIHFTYPEPTMAWIDWSVTHGCPMIIGTTGFKSEDLDRIKKAAENVAIVMAPNMSIGVNVLYSLCRKTAQSIGETFDVEIAEFHHRFKKDAPSGTALELGAIIAKETGVDLKQDSVHGREGIVGQRPHKQIGFHAMRGGDLVSEHSVIFTGMGERLTLNHLGYSRQAFAEGSMAAARFVFEKEKGLYDMQDVLGLK